MIKCEVTEYFTLKDFYKLKNIQRKTIEEKGSLFIGDTFECDEEMVKYLTGHNKLGKTVVKVIEVKPEIKEEVPVIENIDEKIEKIQESAKEEVKKKSKKRTSKK